MGRGSLMGGLAILAAFGLVWGIGDNQIRSFERKAASDIAAQLEGPRKIVTVRTQMNGLAGLWGEFASVHISAAHFSTPGLPLFTEPRRSKRGVVKSLTIHLEDFVLNGLEIQSLDAVIPNCRYDLGLALSRRKIRLSQSGIGEGMVVIRQEALERWILRKFHEIKRVSVRIDKDRAWVEGFGEFLIAKANFAVIADLSPVGGTQLVLDHAKVYFDWRRVEDLGKKALLDVLNPVVDLRKDLNLYDAIEVQGIRLRDGKVVAWGKTRIPVKTD